MTIRELIGMFIDPLNQEIEVIGEDGETLLFSGNGANLTDDIQRLEIIAIANINDDFNRLAVSVEQPS